MHCPFFFFMNSFVLLLLLAKAAEQAKASPALVAKDPGTVANKKEEEDLAKGEYIYLLTWWIYWLIANNKAETNVLLPSPVWIPEWWLWFLFLSFCTIPGGFKIKTILWVKNWKISDFFFFSPYKLKHSKKICKISCYGCVPLWKYLIQVLHLDVPSSCGKWSTFAT